MIKEEFGDQVKIINYSKLIDPVLNKDNEYMKSKFPEGNFDASKINSIFNRPSKKHGRPIKNKSKAVEKYKNDVNSWTEQEKIYIESKMDKELILFFENL